MNARPRSNDAAARNVGEIQEQPRASDSAAILSSERRVRAAGIFQELLVDMIDLSLQAKQAHWNVRGRMFRDLHLLLDELVEVASDASDRIAERCLALGIAADGRVVSVAHGTHLQTFPEGRIADVHVVDLIVARLHTISTLGRGRLAELGELDLVSQDLAVEVLGRIEKMLWAFDAHRPVETI